MYTSDTDSIVYLPQLIHPPKINMEPKHYPVEKENPLSNCSNLHFCVP